MRRESDTLEHADFDTLLISTLTLATGRTTVLQVTVHLVIFAVFVFLSAVR